jgi:exodeoxyribonuclease VII large subunit
MYLTLVDPDTDDKPGYQPQLSITLFKPQLRNVRATLARAGDAVELTVGVRVRVGGTLGSYPARSTLQLRMYEIDPTFTLGVLNQNRAAVLEALTRDGLLDRNAAVPMAELPLRVALITSVGSAAHADALHELEHSGIGFTVLQLDARTQGAEAVPSVVAALRTADRLDVDAVLLVRGGGSATDLAAFDDEQLARAIAAMRTPVVTGVGHEVDHSIADEVAHTAAKTPTAAAAHLAALVDATSTRVEDLAVAAGRATELRLASAEQRVERLARRGADRARTVLLERDGRVTELERRTRRAAERTLERATDRVTTLQSRARIHDPAAALSRGWSITRTASGDLVRDPSSLAAGDELVTQLHRGVVRSAVTATATTELDTATDTEVDTELDTVNDHEEGTTP